MSLILVLRNGFRINILKDELSSYKNVASGADYVVKLGLN